MCKSTEKSNYKGDSHPKYDPVVFVNNPISSEEFDAVGFDTQISTIMKGIENGATMIGIIADYGAGKSSITELLCKKIVDIGYPKVIKINMWDSLSQVTGDPQSSVTNATKSFLYQLSNGYDTRLGKYVNRMLNKNYGNISFAIRNTMQFLWGLIFTGIFFILYEIAGISRSGIMNYMPAWTVPVASFFKLFRPIYLVLMLAAFLIGAKGATIVFSHWKMSNRREIEINEVYETYQEVIAEITKSFKKENTDKKKQVVIIDDLDRIHDSQSIISFLKELYRFQDCNVQNADRFVFIVSIKSENLLQSSKSESLYPKIFDLTLALNPIHFDDYDSVLLQLINSNPPQKEALQELLGITITNTLPESFKWIKKGENLTLRDLKARLNSAISTMVTLKNKSYANNSTADFEACAAVSYLQSQYPNDYNILLKCEHEFAAFMKESHHIVNQKKDDSDFNKLIETCKRLVPSLSQSNNRSVTEKFISEFSFLVFNEVIDDDFRMYFYTYPSGSHIKTTEEREICNYLLFPDQHTIRDSFEESCNHAYKNGPNDTISSLICTLNTFPFAVIANDYLFRDALNISISKTFLTFEKYIIKNFDSENDHAQFWARVNRITNTSLRSQFIHLCIESILDYSSQGELLRNRKDAIVGFQQNILELRSIFNQSSSIPQITEEEIALIDNPLLSIRLINLNNISRHQLSYFPSLITKKKISNSDELIDIAVSALSQLIQFDSAFLLASDILLFLNTNIVICEKLFKFVANSSLDHKEIANYLDRLDPETLTPLYIECIDKIGFSTEISESIVKKLLDYNLPYTPILYYLSANTPQKIDNVLSNVDQILELCNRVNNNHPDLLIKFRFYCVVSSGIASYLPLYKGDFPLITQAEYKKISPPDSAIKLINPQAITSDNLNSFCDILYLKDYASTEILHLFEHLFSCESNELCINDKSFGEELIYAIDFRKIQLRKLTKEQRNNLYDILTNIYTISDSSEAIRFSHHLNCFIPQVEEIILQGNQSDYYQTISDLNELTECGIQFLSSNFLTIPFPDSLCKTLYSTQDYQNYIIGVSLRTKNLIHKEEIDFDNYFEVYKNVNPMFEIMSQDAAFLEELAEYDRLTELSEELIAPIFHIPQTRHFINYMFSDSTSKTFKIQYISTLGKFKTESDSILFQKRICTPENIELVDTTEMRDHIREQLWSSNPYHKGVFTRKWNERWQDRLENVCV